MRAGWDKSGEGGGPTSGRCRSWDVGCRCCAAVRGAYNLGMRNGAAAADNEHQPSNCGQIPPLLDHARISSSPVTTPVYALKTSASFNSDGSPTKLTAPFANT